VQHAKQHVAGYVTREHAPGPIGSVRAGRQTHDQQLRAPAA